MCKGLATAAMLLLSLSVWAQDATPLPSPTGAFPANKEVLHSSMFGIGWSNILDTYLAPYNYTGSDFRFQRETTRMTNLWHAHVCNQRLIDVNFSTTDNRAGNHDEYAGGIRYSQGWYYNFGRGNVVNPAERAASPLSLAAGLAATGYLGGIYMVRSGNNPAQLKSSLMVEASALATFDMKIGRRHYVWRYQFSLPLMGIAFSPNYGQSYYEIFSLQNDDRNILFAYPGNMPSMRHRLTVEIPFRRAALRLGYVAQINQSTFHHLKYHQYSHDIMVGFSKYLYRK